jgi:glycosyltransferase involved in cell wall biosynthesis
MRLPVRLRQILALFRPARIRRELRRIVAKWRRRLAGVDGKVVTLEPEGEPRGDVLVSYILDPFLLPADAPLPHSHTHFWESRQIARTFVDLGYRVDVISWKNTDFVPEKRYRAVLDVRLNMERWAEILPPGCVKILHAETAHWSFNNRAQRERLEGLAERRGIRLPPNKMVEENRAVEAADCVTLIGNDFTAGTYRFAGKPTYPISISTPLTYPELDRSFEECRRRFLWFGSGGLVHKGLDRVLEAFEGMPDLHLTVCGPIQQEREFERAYYRHLYDLPNVHTYGWIDVAGDDFLDLCRRTVALIYPSCSEGQCGGVVTCMHAGLIPAVSAQTGVPIDPSYGVLLPDCEVETLARTARELSERPPEELRETSRRARLYAREHHTRERFAAEYRAAVEEILATFPAEDGS